MSKKSSISIKKRLSILLLGGIFVSLSIFSLFAAPPASAAVKGTSAQQDRTIMYALLRCLDDSNIDPDWGSTNVTADRINTALSDNNLDEFIESDNDYAVGHEVDPNDGRAKCSQISLNRALKPIGKDTRWLLMRVYDLGHKDVDDHGNVHYNLLPALKDAATATVNNAVATAIRNEAKKKKGLKDVGQDEKDRRIAVSLGQCLEVFPDDGQVASSSTVTLEDKKYQFIDDMGKSDKISVGYDMEADGSYTCQSLVGLARQYHSLKKYPLGGPDKILRGDDGDTTTASSASGSASDECDTQFSSDLSWAVCPVISGFNTVVSELDNVISSQLSVGSPGNGDDPSQIFCSSESSGKSIDNCRAYHQAWISFRNLALGLLVIIGLIMILSEMAGFEFFDAYTMRKVLPRLIVAAIGISLSWQLMQLLVELSNAVGYGVRYLIYQPFVNALPADGASILAGGGTIAAGFLTIGGIFLLGVFGMLSFALTAAIAVFVAFLVLILRQLLIIVLVIISPVAIVLYILPNTEKFYKLWWESFSKALLMFPMIAAMIAVGRVFAAVSSNGNTVAQILGFAAYFAPYFMIPMTFKFSGQALSMASGFFQQQSQGLQKGLGQYRAGKMQQNVTKMKSGDRWQGNNRFARGFNATTRRASLGMEGRFGFGERGRGAQDIQRRAGAREAQKNPKMQELAFDDNAIAVMAASGGTAAGADRAARRMGLSDDQRRRAVGTAQSVGFNNSNTAAAIDLMAQNKSRAFSEANGLAGQAGMDMIRESASRISGNDVQQTENIMGGYGFHSRNAGRLDLGGEGPGGTDNAGWNRASVSQHAAAFGASTGHFMNQYGSALSERGGVTDYAELETAAVALSEMHNALPQATAENQGHINRALDAAGVDLTITGERGNSVEEQLARRVNARAGIDDANGLDAATIRTTARQYGSGDPLQSREAGDPEG